MLSQFCHSNGLWHRELAFVVGGGGDGRGIYVYSSGVCVSNTHMHKRHGVSWDWICLV